MLFKSLLISLSVILVAMVPQDAKKVDVNTTVDVKVVGGNHAYTFVQEGGGPFQFSINGEDIEIDGQELEVGESRTLETEEGTVTISRDEEGLLITDHEGEEIRILDHLGELGENGHIFIHSEVDRDVQVFSIKDFEEEGITISGLEGLGEDIQERVREALESAGVDMEINFKDKNLFWVDEDGTNTNVSGNMVFISEDGVTDCDVKTKFRVIRKSKHKLHNDTDQKDTDQEN